jgi:hypothetical protein
VLDDFPGCDEPEALIHTTPSAVACSNTSRPASPSSSASIMRLPMRWPCISGATITRPRVEQCAPQFQDSAVPSTLPIPLGDHARTERQGELPILEPMRPL